ncbi:MAG: M48 family metalloprotease [Candidatus Accumulibacter propinquus]|jgi:STE24 endopeptidase
MGELWWLYVWLFWCAFNLLLLFIYPTWIAPLFNKFVATRRRPCSQNARRSPAGTLRLHQFWPLRDGWLKRSGHGNAYFTGFGKTKRIVFFDTLLGRLQAVEVEAVLAHELGHFKAPARCQADRHAVRHVARFSRHSRSTDRCRLVLQRPGVDARNTALGLVLFFLAGPVFTFLLTPLLSLLSRRDEFEADRYAAGHASAGNLVSALVKLYEDNAATLTPDPLHSLFYDSHPPAPCALPACRTPKPRTGGNAAMTTSNNSR